LRRLGQKLRQRFRGRNFPLPPPPETKLTHEMSNVSIADTMLRDYVYMSVSSNP
jgi:hypothetical protein